MDNVVAIPEKIVSWLSEQEELNDVTFFTEFPPTQKAVPLKKAIVSVGIEAMEIVDKFLANDDGVLEKQEHCRTANITARLSICVPYSYGGTACHDYFTKIIDALTFRTDLSIIQSGCNEIESDRDTSALVCHGWFKIQADFCPGSLVEDNFLSVFDKSFICGSHVSNNDIHITSEERNYWNSHIVSGYYIGTGNSAQTVTLGFKPKAVFIFTSDNPSIRIDFDAQTAKNSIGIAMDGHNTAGLCLTNTGFKTSKSVYGETTSYFNEAAIIYAYIAFK